MNAPVGLRGSTVVFDLDGTLVDTAPDLVLALNHILASRNRPPLALDTVRMLVGHGARALIERGFAETGDPVRGDELPELVAQFVDYYAAHIAERSTIFPGALGALSQLQAWNINLAVCTNKFEGLAVKLLQTIGLGRFFPVIVGGDTLASKKPDPAVYHETVRRAGGVSSHSLMVGDSPTDAATAKGAGVPFLAVSFGYTPVPPTELGADFLIDRYDQLIKAIEPLLATH